MKLTAAEIEEHTDDREDGCDGCSECAPEIFNVEFVELPQLTFRMLYNPAS